MRGKILVTASLFLIIGCYSTSKFNPQPVPKPPHAQRLLLAVVDFQNKSGDADNNALIEGVTGTIIDELQTTARFRLVERQRLKSILNELKLDMVGLIDGEKAREVGKMMGVDALLFGNLSAVKFSQSRQSMFIAWTQGKKIEVSLDARLVDVVTGEIYASAKAFAHVNHREWTAFWILKLGGEIEKSTMTQTAIELACKELVNDLAIKSPSK